MLHEIAPGIGLRRTMCRSTELPLRFASWFLAYRRGQRQQDFALARTGVRSFKNGAQSNIVKRDFQLEVVGKALDLFLAPFRTNGFWPNPL